MCLITLLALCLGAARSAYALGLTELRIHSSLGQPLRATVGILLDSNTDINAICFKSKIESSDGNFLSIVDVQFSPGNQGRTITLTTRHGISEPAVKITLDTGCGSQLHREYVALIDPPTMVPVASVNRDENTPVAEVRAASAAAEPATGATSISSKRSKRREAAASKFDQSLTLPAQTKENTIVKSKPATEKKKQKDVLRLSDETFVIPQQGLRYSDSLSSADQPQQNMDDLRLAQARLAAILRDENPDVIAALKAKEDQKRIQQLETTDQARERQSRIDKAVLEDLKEHSFSRNWIIALCAVLIAALSLIAVMYVHLRKLQKKIEYSWWDHDSVKKEPERKKNLSEIVDNIQASIDPEVEDSIFKIREPKSGHSTTSKTSAPSGLDKSAAFIKTHPVAAVADVKSVLPKIEFGNLEENNSTFNFFATRGTSVKVEEISDVTQEAEFWISVNDPQRAIEILEPQVEVDQPNSPVPWLYLLDLYRSVKNKDKYDTLRERFVSFFNAQIPTFEQDLVAADERHLEDFTHLTEKICGLWKTNEILPFLESLLVDDRDGQRMGFELSVYRDILLLIGIAHELERTKPALSNGWGADDSVSMPPIEFDKPGGVGLGFDEINFDKDL